MSLLLVEQSGQRHPIELNGKLLIGRGSASKLRIDHPLVSRDHAIIEKNEAGSYLLRDCGSRNGTQVNGTSVKGLVSLQDGDRINVGPTTIWFRTGTEDHVETLPARNADEGVVFECNCGARLWAPMTLAGSQVRCRRCGRDTACPTIFANTRSTLEDRLGVVPPPAPPTDAEVAAAPTCSICLSKVIPTEEKHKCESCGTVYHEECWVSNCGCASYGCKQVNSLSEDGTPIAAPTDAQDELAVFDQEADEIGKSQVPWDAALIGVSVVAALLGLLLFGALSLLTAIFSAAYLLRRRTAWVFGALILSLAGFAAGVVVSGLWYYKITPLDWFGK